LTYITTNITTYPIGLDGILMIIRVSTFITVIILKITLVIVNVKIFTKTERHFFVFVYICLIKPFLYKIKDGMDKLSR